MPRVLVYGRNKKGKTHFGTSAPNVLFLDPEAGTDSEKKIDPDVYPCNTWEDYNDAYMFLKGGGVSPISGDKYKWVQVDALTKTANIALRWVMNQEEERNLDRRPGQVGKQDYGRAGEMVKGMLFNLHGLHNIGIIITAQERMIEVEDLSDDSDEDSDTISFMHVPDLPKGVRSSVNSIVDVIGRIYTVQGTFPKQFKKKGTDEIITKEVEGIQRRLWIGPHSKYDTGYRSEHFILPNYISDPTIPKLVRAMREGKV